MTEYHRKEEFRTTDYPRGKNHNDDPIVEALLEIMHRKKLSYHSVEQVGKLPSGQICRLKEGAEVRHTTIRKLANALGYKLVLQRLD